MKSRYFLAVTAIVLGFLSERAIGQQTSPNPATALNASVTKVDAAYAAFQSGLYLTAKKEAEERLKRYPDDAIAMTLLGELYSQGLGVSADPVIAAQWYGKAANLGDYHAMEILGLMKVQGVGTEKNPKEGKALLEQAVEKGSPIAAYNLALLLLSSSNPNDVSRAALLLRKAADAEISDAQYAIGILYRTGRGVEKNPVEAASWLKRATDNGSVEGEIEYAIIAAKGEGIPLDEQLAAKHFRRAAYRGNPIAQNRLARMYAIGLGVSKDRVEAASWHMLAASNGLADAWLDADLRDITPDERARAERLMRERILLIQ